MATQIRRPSPPLTDAIAVAVSRMVDDHGQDQRREPGHAQLESAIERAGLAHLDPGRDRGKPMGKERRLRAVLNAAQPDYEPSGQALVGLVVSEVRGCGGFRPGSMNFIGQNVIDDLRAVFASEGWVLESDGELRPALLDRLDGIEARQALWSYVRRIRHGSADDALVVGTGKDLLEATAAHMIAERYGAYNVHDNFPTLLGQAFIAVGLATPMDPVQPGESVHRGIERQLYELGCSVNRLRNREGIGHGRPFLPSLTPGQATVAANAVALISEMLLERLSPPS